MDSANARSIADAAKALLNSRGFGILSTHSIKAPGYPVGSVVAYAVDANGEPVFLLSRLATHTANLLANAAASLLVFEEAVEWDVLNAARATFLGGVAVIAEQEAGTLRAAYLERHPEAAQWIDFGDFALYRMKVAQASYVGGFGVMGWISYG